MELLFLLGFCLLLVCAFEFINGFHDTANAVAPVIYTNSLSAKKAVLLAALFNFLGVMLGGISVAMGIIHLLPLDLIAHESVAFGVCVVLSLLISAIIWNFGTWYLGIPASSSHTLIGSILGVSIALSTLDATVALPWKKVSEVLESLLVSPFIGFLLAFGAMHILHLYIRNHRFFKHPDRHWNKNPKLWIRGSLIGSSALVSFAHGSNDGQKGVGLAMLILITLAPAYFAMNADIEVKEVGQSIAAIHGRIDELNREKISDKDALALSEIEASLIGVERVLTSKNTPLELLTNDDLSGSDKLEIRQHILKIKKDMALLSGKSFSLIPSAKAMDEVVTLESLDPEVAKLSEVIDYAPWQVLALISISLGLGTMIGWKRIVVTIGEKIGKEHLSYAQGAVASMMTAATISSASHLGLPVSTTHIMSSGIAGTAAHEYGKHGLRGDTIRSILLAWVLTLPVSTVLAGVIFLILKSLFVA